MDMPTKKSSIWITLAGLWSQRDHINNVILMDSYLEQMTQESPDDFDAWVWWGRIAHFLSMYAGSEKNRFQLFEKGAYRLNRALKIDANNMNALFWWAMCEHPIGDINAIIKRILPLQSNYGHVLPTLPDTWEMADDIMTHWAQRHDPVQAKRANDLLIKLSKTHGDDKLCWLWLARCYMYRGMLNELPYKKKEYFEKGYHSAKKAVKLTWRDAMSHYWAAINLGLSVADSLMRQLAASKDIIPSLRILASENPNYRCGAISHYQALAIARAGTFSRRVMNYIGAKDETVFLTISLFAHLYPYCYEAQLAKAELALSMGHLSIAKDLLTHMLNENHLKDQHDYYAENLICLREAEKLMKSKHIKL